jgi:hypothetical protein
MIVLLAVVLASSISFTGKRPVISKMSIEMEYNYKNLAASSTPVVIYRNLFIVFSRRSTTSADHFDKSMFKRLSERIGAFIRYIRFEKFQPHHHRHGYVLWVCEGV